MSHLPLCFACALALMTVAGTVHGSSWVVAARYYDPENDEYFIDFVVRVPPFTRENGNTAVRAHFLTCGQCTDEEQFLGYYEKYSAEAKALMESAQRGANRRDDDYYTAVSSGRFYSTDARTWYRADSEEGMQITHGLKDRCPEKTLRYCPAPVPPEVLARWRAQYPPATALYTRPLYLYLVLLVATALAAWASWRCLRGLRLPEEQP